MSDNNEDLYIDTITSNGDTYNIRDTATNQSLTNLTGEFESSMTDINNRFNGITDVGGTIDSKISDLNNQIHTSYDDRIDNLENNSNSFNTDITAIKLVDLDQNSNISTLNNFMQAQYIGSPGTPSINDQLRALVSQVSRLSVTTQDAYENLENTSQVDNDMLYIIWESNKLARLYYKGYRMDVIPYEAVDFLINYLQNSNYWTSNIESIDFINNIVISPENERNLGLKLEGSSHTNAYMNNSDTSNIKFYTDASHYSISDLHSYFDGYQSLISADLGNVRNCSNLSHAFDSCINLEDIQTPSSYSSNNSCSDSDWSYAFRSCEKIESIHSYGTNLNNAFAYCIELSELYIDTINPITDVNYIFATNTQEQHNDRIINIHIKSELYDSFISVMKDNNSHLFGTPYNELDPAKWHDLQDGNGCYYEDGPDSEHPEKLITIYNNY